MKKQKDGKPAKDKRLYVGPRVTVLSPNSAKAKTLVNEAGNESRNQDARNQDARSEDQESGSKVKAEPPKAKKRSA